MSGPTDVQRALTTGAFRSIRACSLPADDTLPVMVWRRYRWTITGAALFLLVELVGIGALVAGGMNHF